MELPHHRASVTSPFALAWSADKASRQPKDLPGSMHEVKHICCGTPSVCSNRAKPLQPTLSHLQGRSLARQAAAHSTARKKPNDRRKSTCHATATGPGPEDRPDEDSSSVDIDLLAQQLTKEAARLRSTDPQDDVPYDRPASLEDTAAASASEATEQSPPERSGFTGAFGDEVRGHAALALASQ